MKKGIALAIVPLLLIIAGCAYENGAREGAGSIPSEFVQKRSSYDTSKSFQELVKPHYAALDEKGELVEARGEPVEIVEIGGLVRIKLQEGERVSYIDPLALESEVIGEHPVHKVFRLEAMGVSVEPRLKRALEASEFPDNLFHTISFEYLAGKETKGVITEVFQDGTFLVIPFATPPEWQSGQSDISSPTHLHVDPRALMGDSPAVAEYEKEILALSFNDQRYPPVALARKQCELYYASRENDAYQKILASIGWRFSPEDVLPAGQALVFGERVSYLLWEDGNDSFQYFGFEGRWIAETLRALGASWLGECDRSGIPRQYWTRTSSAGAYYVSYVESLRINPKERNHIVQVDEDGRGETIYTAPGMMLMARPFPYTDGYWIVSAEGFPAPEGDSPADPRWQSVYIVNVENPEEYYVIEYPFAKYGKQPRNGRLYGSSDMLRSDGKILYAMLYGFKDEGGGLWALDISRDHFYTNPDAFAKIFDWDHGLSWMVIDVEGSVWSVFLTGKEVDDNFAMTANYIRLREDGLETTLQSKERLARMVGWNPVPFALHAVGEDEYIVLVETHYNYESSLFPRAKGVYLVPVDTSAQK